MSIPGLLRELRGVNFSCTSSPALSASIIKESMLTTEAGIGGRAIDRCSPHLRDPLRAKSLNPVLSHQQPRKTSNFNNSKKGKSKKTQSERRPIELPSPASSRRHLLDSDSNSEEFFERSVMVNEPLRFQSAKIEKEVIVARPLSRLKSVMVEETSDARPSSSAAAASPQEQQVVVLRVSLHCKGCEGKVRKHISKMGGVTSFTTDLVNKKVTVTGDVTPLAVLNSISKVKNAQLWPSQPRATS